MHNINEILESAAEQLRRIETVNDVKFNHLMDRYFSVIYEVTAISDSSTDHYMLKISTTDRTSQLEYDQYVYLQDRGVRSLVPIYYSDEFNYLITKKENLQQFDVYLKELPHQAAREKSFFELGVFFKDMDLQTGSVGVFSKSEFDDYTIPRLNNLSKLPKNLRTNCMNLLKSASTQLDGKPIKLCFVSDFSLGNIHLDDHLNFVVLDLGDSSIGNRYLNISYIRLNSLYGSLNQYVTNGSRDKRYFDAFMKGYEIEPIHYFSLNLYEIRHLIMMISFVSTNSSTSQNPLRRMASRGSSWYLRQRYILRLRTAMRQLKKHM